MVTHKTVNGGLTGLLRRLLQTVENKEVYVGIPQKNASRNEKDVNNAELLYIHTHGIRHRNMRKEMNTSMASGDSYGAAYDLYMMSRGSPLWQSPPRPVLEPAIAAHKREISEQYVDVIRAVNAGDQKEAADAVTKVGELAVGYCRGWFTDPRNGWEPNAPSTVERKGSDRPMIDTGSLRKSITWVVK